MVSFDGAVSSSFVLCLALIDVPPFCTNLKTTYKLYKEGTVHWISLILIYLSRTGILTILTLLFHKHDISNHLLSS